VHLLANFVESKKMAKFDLSTFQTKLLVALVLLDTVLGKISRFGWKRFDVRPFLGHLLRYKVNGNVRELSIILNETSHTVL